MKLHFQSDEGILCGAKLNQPQIVCVWDNTPIGKFDVNQVEGWNSLRDCGKCLRKLDGVSGTIYAVRESK